MPRRKKADIQAEADSKILEEAKKRFRLAVDAEADNRRLALDDINFRHGNQWEDGVKQERELEGRPCLTINKLEQRVDQVTGDQRMNRMGVVVRPMNTAAAQKYTINFTQAEIMAGLIKNIEATSNAKQAYDLAFDHAVGHGFGYWRYITEYTDDDTFDQDIKVKRIPNSFTVYLDPSAEEATKKDARWGFITRFEDKDDYPNSDWERGMGEDRDLWFDNDKVRVAEYFRLVPRETLLWQVGEDVIKVKDATMDIRDELTEQGVKPSKERTAIIDQCEWFKLSCTDIYERRDFPSKFIPIVPCYGKELNVKGKTYYRGVIRYAKDPQRIYNYTRTASVEQTALAPKAPWVIEERQFGDHKKMWETANAKNYAALPYKNVPGVPPPQRQMPPQPSAGWLSESGIADQDIDAASGMYKASLGAPSNERSGKAINARKVEGDVGTYHFHDNRAMSLQHGYEILTDMIPRVYDSERIIRIKTPEEKEQMVPINQQVYDTETQQWVKVYDLSMGKYEITIDVGASYTTQRQMASESMMELIQYAPQLAPKVLDLIAKNLDWPGADDIAARLQSPDMPPEMVQAEIQKAVEAALQSKTEQNKEAELQIKRFDSLTKRMSMIKDAMADDDKLEVELLKLLDENGVADNVIRGRVLEIGRQMQEETSANNMDYRALWNG